MVEIATTWRQVFESMGIASLGSNEPFDSVPVFAEYQSGFIKDKEYIEGLAAYFSISECLALEAHNSILKQEFSGLELLIRRIHASGLQTGCLSNTNSLHWKKLINPDFYPTIASLPVHMASHNLKLSKPDPKIYRAFEDKVSCQPLEIIYFDDHPGYAQAAQQLGWNSYAIQPIENPAIQMSNFLESIGVIS